MDPIYTGTARRFVLGDDGNPRHEPGLQAWRQWWIDARTAKTTAIKRTEITGSVEVVTSFLVDYQEPDPEDFSFFETIVFHEHDQDWNLHIVRARDRGDALAAHDRLVTVLRIQDGPGGR